MKVRRLGPALGVLGLVGAIPMAPTDADDQALQSVLLKLRCVPSKVVRTELTAEVVSYEVTCKGRSDVVFIVCQGADCRQQTKRRDGEEWETPL